MSPSLQYVQSTQGLLNLGLPRRLARGLCLGRADHVDVADDALPHGLERLEKFRSLAGSEKGSCSSSWQVAVESCRILQTCSS
eukprot:CAMPEP_0173376326 /NCGR_PEP_ID=MMETSP1144-20121109/30110_1 /TAXON_ID=483371 /ORGANISM="non described non described, Strain CCMP2298" /LENGTH=82 /DNA_ID=CAMNT_0014328837 /DNA_START=333 /DNA_END=578 /DNA_ORIENTATION=+